MKVIAEKVKPNYNNGTIGYVKPMFVYNEEVQKFLKAEPDKFPNSGEIFIYTGYDNIDQEYGEGDLFRIDNVEENQDKYDVSSQRSCYYTASYNSVSGLSETEFLPIYNANFNLNNRRIIELDSNRVMPFFINDGSFLYGPFDYDLNKNFWTPISNELSSFTEFIKENEDCILKYNLNDIFDLVIDDYLSDFLLLIQKEPLDIIYVGSKEKTIFWGKNFLKAQTITNEEGEILSKLKDFKIPNLTKKVEKQKLENFKEYINEMNEWVNIELPKFFMSYLNTEQGSKEREKYLETRAETFFKNYRKNEIEAIDKQLQQKKVELEELKNLEENIKLELETKENKIFDGINEQEITILKEIAQNSDLRKRLIEFKDYDNIRELSLKAEARKDVINEDIKKMQDEKVKLDAAYLKMQSAITNVKNEFFDESKFAQKLIDAKIYTDILNNIDPRNHNISEENNDSVSSFAPKVFPKELDSISFMNEIHERLKRLNRSIEFNDLVNYLVCINQNFLTVFAGLPGIGKTSLIDRLARALGCWDNNRFLSISVQKGWTSSKDLIGYYNPLLQKYQPAKTDLYKYLKYVSNDIAAGKEYPCLILLDEANLSPIEHYWSEFSSIYDNDYKKELSLHDDKKINFGDNLKFIATINYDHTTEILSDRLISRAPIIKLSSSDYFYTEEDENSFEQVFETFYADNINNWLKPDKTFFKGDIKARFENIIRVLHQDEDTCQPIIVSIRKQKSVEKYCNVAGSLMKSANQFISLDYAINQNILPLINCRGDNYKKRLVKLQEELKGLELSSKNLDKIIKVGDQNFKHYKFFY